MYWVKTPSILKLFFPKLTWVKPNNQKEIYLTFDDGPTHSVTDILLDILAEKNVRATFFCLGKNIEQSPDLFSRLKKEGHVVGNHGYDHVNAWKTTNQVFFDNIKKSENNFDNNFYRPPYGRFKLFSTRKLRRKYDVIMWDILSGDFDENITAKKCLSNVMRNIRSGSIIVFHDNIKSKEIMLQVVPLLIDEARSKGYSFSTI